jgi:hypothetical protein
MRFALFLPLLIVAMFIARVLSPIRQRMRTAFSGRADMDGLALIATRAILSAPRNIFQICAWNVGTMKVDPWRIRAGVAVQRVSQSLRTWFASLLTGRRVAFACSAALIALLAMQLSAGHLHAHTSSLHVLTATAIPVATLRENRSKLIQKAEGLMKDGKFDDKVEESTIDPGEFRGMTLLDLARNARARRPDSARGSTRCGSSARR